MSSPTHKVPVHPGADDDTDDDDEGDSEGEKLRQDNGEAKESTEDTTENTYEPIKNLVDDPPSEAEDDG